MTGKQICNPIAASFWWLLYNDERSCFPRVESTTTNHGTDRTCGRRQRCVIVGRQSLADIAKGLDKTRRQAGHTGGDTVTIKSCWVKGMVSGQVL